ncbi:hypothetical protein TRVL_05216 [Trypanosoma vivax]|nr:hypothetical protein TRVL_05216 [Trypanosoma vivax]
MRNPLVINDFECLESRTAVVVDDLTKLTSTSVQKLRALKPQTNNKDIRCTADVRRHSWCAIFPQFNHQESSNGNLPFLWRFLYSHSSCFWRVQIFCPLWDMTALWLHVHTQTAWLLF